MSIIQYVSLTVCRGVVFDAYCAYCILRGPIQQSQNDSRIEYGR